MASSLLNLGVLYLPVRTGVHYLMINSPDGADLSLNKLLLLFGILKYETSKYFLLVLTPKFSTSIDCLYIWVYCFTVLKLIHGHIIMLVLNTNKYIICSL